MSENSVEFTVPGEPCAKGRPRFNRATGHAATPSKTVRYEFLVRLSYMQQIGQSVQLEGPLSAEISAYFTIPKSASKKKRQQMLDGELHPTKKPDTDNLAKIVLDALNGIAYADDKDIVRLNVKKIWSEQPRVDVKISRI
ncbi:RusA family crossover junction endodeoxyribonuclease [Faecalibaculum rodentium]|uniref:RusA family crossover junction endodeoxyribonuclease n=2 Tax=Faecalibaculum rodentium TaxID=1702221 RepID=UPI0025A58045|nr:RusA family crossover junction endodeoxyribonuclease [Faecalibaculum rodentium]